MTASSYGVGELINHAISMGCRQLILTLGGTVTNDGGCGMLSALGAKLTDAEGKEIERGGRGLMQIKNMDLSVPRQKMKDIEVIVLYDVKARSSGPGALPVCSALRKAQRSRCWTNWNAEWKITQQG